MRTKRILLSLVFIAVTGCSSGSDEVERRDDVKRGPYVQLGGIDSVVVVWQTFSAGQGALEWGLTDELGTRIDSPNISTSHSITVSGLMPGTYYHYRVLDGDRPITEVLRFHTNHGPNQTNFSFVVLGDSGSGAPEAQAIANLISASDASLALHTGDVIYPDGEEALYDARFFDVYAPFLASNVMYMSLGNHDLHTDNGAPYLNNFYLPTNGQDNTERYYSFDYGHAHFVALDTNQPIGVGSPQRLWLEQDLAASASTWKFVFMHHPPYSASFHMDGDRRSSLEHTYLRPLLAPLFEQFGVDLVFSGHAHSYERTFPILQGQTPDRFNEPTYVNPSGPIYVITGGGGGELTQLDTSTLNARALAVHHFVHVSLEGNELIGRTLDAHGVLIDEFRAIKQ